MGPDITSYTDSGLPEGTTYCYRVAAYNFAGTSPHSNEVCATTPVQTFTPTVYQLAVSPEPVNGTVAGAEINCPGECAGSYQSGISVTLTAHPAIGYEVEGWSGCRNAVGNQCPVQMTQARTVSVTFVRHADSLTATNRDSQATQNNGGYAPDASALLDHFKCYRAAAATAPDEETPFSEFAPAGHKQIRLLDQRIEDKLTHVLHPLGFCNPAKKERVEIQEVSEVIDPTTRLAAYRIKDARTSPAQAKFARRRYTVTNQFGTLMVDLNSIDRLLVPSGISLGGPTEGPAPLPDPTNNVDHYKCYAASIAKGSDEFRELVVDVEDEFGPLRMTVVRPVRLCNPVSAQMEDGSVGEVKNPENHLMCYRVSAVSRPAQPKFTRIRVLLNNQLGPEVLDTEGVDSLCVPSLVESPP
ncbi:MAG: fibronectin type III domain-containing protein [Deltaproteobacteria bacterium]|nr:fibronectin type III domain-containing protein [Deltaproteobacteria bacterium]